MLSVIRTGGKQYIVSPGKRIKIEKLEKKPGTEVAFSDVLLMEKGKSLEIGKPVVKGTKVLAKVLSQQRAKKIIVFKYSPKKRFKKKTGHRQSFTEVEIKSLEQQA